jgi:hypothetical protein
MNNEEAKQDAPDEEAKQEAPQQPEPAPVASVQSYGAALEAEAINNSDGGEEDADEGSDG